METDCTSVGSDYQHSPREKGNRGGLCRWTMANQDSGLSFSLVESRLRLESLVVAEGASTVWVNRAKALPSAAPWRGVVWAISCSTKGQSMSTYVSCLGLPEQGRPSQPSRSS